MIAFYQIPEIKESYLGSTLTSRIKSGRSSTYLPETKLVKYLKYLHANMLFFYIFLVAYLAFIYVAFIYVTELSKVIFANFRISD